MPKLTVLGGFHAIAIPAKLNKCERGVRLGQGFVHL